MKNTDKILLSVLIFLFCVIIGFVATRLIRNHGKLYGVREKQTVELEYEVSDKLPDVTDAGTTASAESSRQKDEAELEPGVGSVAEPPVAVPKKPVIKKVDKIEVLELQEILNSGDENRAVAANFKDRVSRACRYIFIGREDGEGNAPQSYNAIIMNISLGTWKSVTVLGAVYDETDRITQVKMQVNY